MTAAQMGARLGVSQPRVIALERAEAERRVTLASLDRAARALDCTLVYALVPHRPLDAMLKDRARRVAATRLARVDHNMRLEDQALETRELKAELDRLTDELVRGNPRRLWDAR